ncbi:MAG: AraC family transcriptional regulator [Clostridiales bacterium]|nr:AraC family transcriptional regulator [Clostridiales bacterium]
MQQLGYNECKQRGTVTFPISLYHVTKDHPRYRMPCHWHREMELIRVVKGEILFLLNDTSYRAGPGDVLFIAGGVLHSASVPPDCVYDCLVFDLESLLGVRSERGSNWELDDILERRMLVQPLFHQTQQTVCETAWRLFDIMQEQAPGYELAIRGQLYQMLSEIIRRRLYIVSDAHARSQQDRLHRLKKTLRLIESDYMEPLSLEDLSQAAGMSPKYFCRFFRQMTRRTPIDYLNYYRVERACDMFRTRDISVTEAAYRCGFNDAGYFSRTFKKYKGTTPKQFSMQMKQQAL